MEIARAASAVVQVVRARAHGSSKGSRRVKIAQAVSTVARVVCTRSTGRT